ncbi:RidA family protein [Arthrobacter gandavensis]|uniref:RidA family protein n=1 Tax=Arthrobacter gandavensis TaxID=169960 RepID=UPI001890416B|nr:RidA family protein [Arthrobacter gandavensis]MBF4993244.1 RidA family protein [Arthrobacter gandavensis]
MAVTLLNPHALPEVPLYRQVAVASGSRMVFIAGQVAVDSSGGLVGKGDLAAQSEQVYLNLAAALEAAGATFADVAKLTCYLVDYAPEDFPLFMEGRNRAISRLGITEPLPPFTGIGVAALAGPGLLVEIEAVAVLD